MSNENDTFEHLSDIYTHFEGLFLMIINSITKTIHELSHSYLRE